MTRMVIELFKSTAKADVMPITYKGATPALTDVMGGHVHGIAEAFPALYPFIKQGKLRALAITSERRNALLPDLPTAAEQGLPDLFAVNWFAIVAPAKVPRAVVEKLHAALVKTANLPDVKEQFIAVGVESMTLASPEAFGTFLKDELARWGKVTKAADIRAE